MGERSDAYLIVKRGLYYRPKAQGYTGIRDHAGRYTLADAMGYSHPNGPNGPRDGITHIHEDDAPEFSPACFHDLQADHLKKQRDALAAEVLQLREALAWYGEQARLARLIHSEGDAGRHALQDDGGKRARATLTGGHSNG